MAIPPVPAVAAVISVVGVGIFKVVESDHDVPSFLIQGTQGTSRADLGGGHLLI
jgi:hypothetical protein